ncbi:oxidoreductase bli-4 protein [Lasallia pustulata]|uniref:Oxidoreductase bli-4 protein n=1 Tax=Lasallia pustulata TaxID=136370 RepID=A0A1W5DD33_9LECA|nr:oxidoreductase bli-4 protein [Lasallia pustulata]
MVSLLTGNKFDPNTDIPDLSGRTYIVTGGSAGIGFGIVAHLLQHNAAKILLLSNKKQHADEAMEELEKYGDPSRVHWVHCDLSDLAQTHQVGKTLAAQEKRIDALILNAGLGVGSYWETRDNLECHMQVNHLSQFLLALFLLPALLSTPSSRLVVQSSDLHRACPTSTTFATPSELNTDLGPTLLYNRSKLAQILFVRALKRRLDALPRSAANAGVLYVNATHPGGVSTDQPKQAEEAYGLLGKVGAAVARPLMSDPVEKGCRPALFAATAEEVVTEGISGAYIVPDKKVEEPSGQARDEGLGERLWELSMRILEEKVGGLGMPEVL